MTIHQNPWHLDAYQLADALVAEVARIHAAADNAAEVANLRLAVSSAFRALKIAKSAEGLRPDARKQIIAAHAMCAGALGIDP